MDEFERAVPFADPAQADFMAFVLKSTSRVVKGQRYRDAQMEEVVSAVNAMMEFLDGLRRRDVEKEPSGKRVLLVREFRAKKITPGSSE